MPGRADCGSARSACLGREAIGVLVHVERADQHRAGGRHPLQEPGDAVADDQPRVERGGLGQCTLQRQLQEVVDSAVGGIDAIDAALDDGRRANLAPRHRGGQLVGRPTQKNRGPVHGCCASTGTNAGAGSSAITSGCAISHRRLLQVMAGSAPARAATEMRRHLNEIERSLAPGKPTRAAPLSDVFGTDRRATARG